MSEDRAGEMEVGALDVAVVGMAGRFPGADDLETFWKNLREGVESVTHFTVEELRAAGVPDQELSRPDYVRSIGRLRDVQHFDAGFFGYSPREAEILEPAHRLFLECAWEALESAGHAPETVEGRVGVYAGAGHSGYTEGHVLANPELLASVGDFQAMLASGKDFLATRTSYKLDLRGPSVNVQTACSTSLVATHLAVQSLLSGESDLALAGGATVIVPQDTGYLYAPGSIASPDGHCRAFDARSAGTLSGSGVGVVVLRRLADAVRDGDVVHAVIRGSAINNDGAAKVAYTAPGVEGQATVISEALAAADVDPATVGFVEAHGSGTDLGDTIEIAALRRAYGEGGRAGRCAIGAVKTNLGHLDAAAGIAGLIKTVLALEHGQIPPTVHFETPNPKLGLEESPFFVPGRLVPWETTGGAPRRAGVSSFGIGGTNAHVVLEEAPALPPSGPSRPWQLLTLSARTPRALDAATDRLAEHLENRPEQPLADVAFTLREGRRAFPHRRTVVVREGEDAAKALRERTPDRTASGLAEGGSRSVAFLFPGLGDQYPNMARGLYQAEPAFRAEVDRCAELLRPHLGVDVREVIFSGDAPSDAPAPAGFDLKRMLGKDAPADPSAEPLNRTELAQPAVFVVDYALAKLWMSFGVVPDAVIGHSLGEYAAACIAGILPLDDALALVADRARIIQELPGGAMLSVSLDPDAVEPYLTPGVSIATVNAPGLTVVAGPEEAVEAVRAKLEAAGIVARRLPTTHAFHTPMMAPAAERLAERVARTTLRAPSIPMISNVTGTWIGDAEATDPAYWTRHMLGTVRFAEGIEELLKEPGRVLLEVGPGQTLSTFVRQRPAESGQPVAVIPSLRYAYDRKPDQQFLLEALGRLWLAGIAPDWKAFRAGERRRRVVLPTYPWERQRYWIEAPSPGSPSKPAGRRPDPADWTYLPTWTRTPVPAAGDRTRILVLTAGTLGDALAAALERAGREVARVRSGAGFSGGERSFTVRADSKDDHRALVESLLSSGFRPGIVVDARAADGAGSAFGALLLLAEAVGGIGPVELVAVTAGAEEVTGDEALEPRSAALVGASRTIPLEYPDVRSRLVDVPRAPSAGHDEEALAARLAAEVLADVPAGESVVAYRGRHRWARGYRAARPSAPAAALREGGVYLVAGGPDARSDAIARALAGAGKARIALASPSVDPQRVRELEALGAQVIAIPADTMDESALAGALSAVEERFGPVTGVVWSPELRAANEIAGIAEARPAEWSAELEGIDAGLRALDAALGERTPEWCLVESSMAGVLGVLGRVRVAAANAVTDAYAALRARSGGASWTSVAWDHAGPDEAIAHGDGTGIGESDLPRALSAVLALAGEPHVLVSPVDVEERLRWLTTPASHAGTHPGTEYERPELETEYHAPTTEVEERLAALWSELLGVDRIGIHDDFFALGGHSLMATQIISRVRDMFQLELSLAAIFEAPTVARLAALVEEAIIAELEALSDEEAAALVGG